MKLHEVAILSTEKLTDQDLVFIRNVVSEFLVSRLGDPNKMVATGVFNTGRIRDGDFRPDSIKKLYSVSETEEEK